MERESLMGGAYIDGTTGYERASVVQWEMQTYFLLFTADIRDNVEARDYEVRF